MPSPVSQRDREEDTSQEDVELENDLPMGRTYKLAVVILVIMVLFVMAGSLLGWFRFVVVALVFWPFLAALYVLYRYRHPATVFFHPTHFVVKYHIGKESRIAPEDVTEVREAGWSFPDCHVFMYVTSTGWHWGFTLTSEVSQELFERYPEILSKVNGA